MKDANTSVKEETTTNIQKTLNMDLIDKLGQDSGLLPVTNSEADSMDMLRRRLLIPIVPLKYLYQKPTIRKVTMRKKKEDIRKSYETKCVGTTKTFTQPKYVEVTGIIPPAGFEPARHIYEGKTIKEALDSLLEDIRTERRAKAGSPVTLPKIFECDQQNSVHSNNMLGG